MRSLQEAINKKRSESGISNESRAAMGDAIEELRETCITDKAIKLGDHYIDFELPNSKGEHIKLSDQLMKSSVILTFYRGGWCPYCNLQLRAYQKQLSEFRESGAELIAISPESIESASAMVQKQELMFEVLTDRNNSVARQYGLVFKLSEKLKEVYLKNGLDLSKNQNNDNWELPVPATYIISQEGVIKYSFLNVDYLQRSEPSDILSVLDSMSNKEP